MHYFKMNIGDYAKKAGRLSMLEHGAYTLLIHACYDRERFPTLDDAIDWCWARTKEEKDAVEFVLSKFFDLVDGVYIQNRIQEEVNKYHENAQTNQRIATERENKRKDKTRTVNEPCESVNEAPPNQEPLTINQEPQLKPIDTNVSIVGNESHVPDQHDTVNQNTPDCPHKEIISLYAKHLPMGIQPREWDGARAATLKARWREKPKRQDLGWWDGFFKHASESKFLTGQVSTKDRAAFEITLPWMLKSENFKKIIEGVYHR